MNAQTKKHRTEAAPKALKHTGKFIKIQNLTLLGFFVLFILYQTIGQNASFLWKTQELDLFAFNQRYFLDAIEGIGGLSVYLGSFLTQFFYIPWLGSLIYLALLLFVSYLTSKAFNLKGRAIPLAFIPSLALLLTMCELGYMIYILKINGYVYVTVLGVIGILWGIILFQKIKRIHFQVIYILAYLLVGYPVFGAYALFGGGLFLLYTLKSVALEKNKAALIPAVTALSGIFLIPIVYYQFLYSQTIFKNLSFALLPAFNTGSEKILWLPFVLIALFFIVAVLWKQGKESKKTTFVRKSAPVFLFLSTLVIVAAFSYKDENLKTELAMQSASEKGNWNEVLRIAQKQKDEPTRLIVMNTNLALFKLNLAGDKMFNYKDGNKAINTPGNIFPMQIAGKFFYYQYGKLNYCYRWCMEEMVEFKMNANNLKYFVLSATLNKETALANKYNEVLKSTLFYKSWAEKQQVFIDDPETIMTVPEYTDIMKLNAFNNVLDGDNSMLETYLLNCSAYSRGGNPALVTLSILSNLQMKNIERFWPGFFLYARTHDRIPVHFQEAALLYYYLEHKVDISQVKFDKQVMDDFQLLLDFSKKQANYPEETTRKLYFNQFGGTFWYYYFFVNTLMEKKKETSDYYN